MTANNNVIMITYWANPNDLVDTNKGLIPESQWHDNEVKRCNKHGRIVMKKITNLRGDVALVRILEQEDKIDSTIPCARA